VAVCWRSGWWCWRRRRRRRRRRRDKAFGTMRRRIDDHRNDWVAGGAVAET
jgi:hypothetical protein